MRILHHQPAHTHSTVVAFNLSQFTAAIDEINHVITHSFNIKTTYTYVNDRNEPFCKWIRNSLKPTNALEKAEFNIYLDDISFGYRNAK